MFLAVTPSLCLNWGTENKAQFKKYKNQSKMEKTLQWMLQKIRLFLSAHLENRSLKPELDFFSIFLKWSPPPPGTPVLSGALKLCTETTCRQQLPLPLLTGFKFPVIHYLMVFFLFYSLFHAHFPLYFFLKKLQQANLLSLSISSSTKSKSAGLQGRTWN